MPLLLMVATVLSAPAETGPWTLASSDTRIELAVTDDQLIVRRLEGTQAAHNWAGEGMVVDLMPRVWFGDESRTTRWAFQGTALDATAGTLALSFENAMPPLVLRSVWRARPGRGPVEHWMVIENRSDRPVAIAEQDSLSLAGLTPGGPADIWWVKRGAADARAQGGTFTERVSPQTVLELTSNPTDGASPVPWLAVQVGEERGLYVGWEFSGVGRIEARGHGPDGLSLRVGNAPGFRTDVLPGESLLIPPAFVGCYAGDVEEGSYQLHRFIIEKLRPPMPPGWPDPMLMCALYVDSRTPRANADYVLDNARLAHETGFETFMVDAMWFPQVGDWRWDPERYPEGCAPIERFLHQRGMGFALWCAWTNGGASDDPAALSVRGPHGHPDWFTGDVPADWEPGLFWGASLCLGSDEARQWCEAKAPWLVSQYHLDYLKHDIGPIVTACSRADHRHHYGTDVSYWSALGYYRVMEELRQRRPHAVLENCSGAGHIKDFGAIQRTHYTATTDTLSNLPDRQSIYDSTYAMPPLLLQAYTLTNAYGLEGDDPGPFLWRSAMMSAWQMAPVNSENWTAEQKLTARRATDVYKAWIRPVLQDAKVHHILPRPDGLRWDGLFYFSPTLRRGTVYIFRPDSEVAEMDVPLRGLRIDGRYRVWCEDGSIAPGVRSGRSLMGQGLRIRLPGRYTSDLIYVQDASLPVPDGMAKPGPFALGSARTTSDAFAASASLAWQPSRNARSYRVVVSSAATRSVPAADMMVLSAAADVPELAPSETFCWRVEAIGWGGRRWNAGGAGSFRTPALRPLPGVAFVSDLPWVSATAGPTSPCRDTNYLGKTMAIDGVAMPKGVWTHSFADGTPADVVLDITGKGFGDFAARVGLDDISGGGSIQFQVLVDGVVAASSRVLDPRETELLRVPVRGARTVTLRVLNGGDGYECDHAVWGLARFIAEGTTDPLGR